ncbi:MAG: CPBP family intramembrane metalloprotease [Lachnospiraceae bacterium]|nr:CPBP family intramembrane metalloprotease [Lachnospiraceae bacterium]
MNEKRLNNHPLILLWLAIYPALLYYAILYIASTLCLYIVVYGLKAEMTLSIQAVVLLISSIVTIPFIFQLYASDRNGGQGMMVYFHEHKPSVSKEKIINCILASVAIILIGFSFNNIISMTPLIQMSKGYATASENLYGGSLAVILLRSGLFVPILEELTFRGVILFRMEVRLNKWWALGISTILFALMHMNIVQMPYALILGVGLGLIAIRVQHVYASIVAHMAVNIFTVLRVSFGWWDNLADNSVSSWLISIGTLLIGIGVLIYFMKERHVGDNSDTISKSE